MALPVENECRERQAGDRLSDVAEPQRVLDAVAAHVG
jgi:hypothetical protein